MVSKKKTRTVKLPVELGLPDFATRLNILKSLVDQGKPEDHDVPEDVLVFLANMKTNIQDLEGALIRVVAHALLEGKKKVSLDSAKKALEEVFDHSN